MFVVLLILGLVLALPGLFAYCFMDSVSTKVDLTFGLVLYLVSTGCTLYVWKNTPITPHLNDFAPMFFLGMMTLIVVIAGIRLAQTSWHGSIVTPFTAGCTTVLSAIQIFIVASYGIDWIGGPIGRVLS